MLMKILIAGIALLAGTCSVVVLVLEISFVEEFLLTVETFKIPCVSLQDGAKLVAVSVVVMRFFGGRFLEKAALPYFRDMLESKMSHMSSNGVKILSLLAFLLTNALSPILLLAISWRFYGTMTVWVCIFFTLIWAAASILDGEMSRIGFDMGVYTSMPKRNIGSLLDGLLRFLRSLGRRDVLAILLMAMCSAAIGYVIMRLLLIMGEG